VTRAGASRPNPLRFGVLGGADIAVRRVLPALVADPATQVSALASRDADRAEELARRFGARPVHGYAALLARPDVDAVYVPLPAALHAEWVERALDAGKHVLAEKPLTTCAATTRRLLHLARRRGLVLRENVLFVHHPQHEKVRNLLAEGAVGTLQEFRATFTVPARPAGDIRLDPALGGGALLDTGVYPLRAAVHLLGDELRVVGASLRSAPGDEVDTSGGALLRRSDGVHAHVSFGIDHAYRSAYELTGTTGRISLEHAFTPPADHRPRLVLTRGRDVRELLLEPFDQVAGAVASFAEAVHTRDAGAANEATAGSWRQAMLLEAVRTAADRDR
jgi:NDP-hexose-3-ketoreductase